VSRGFRQIPSPIGPLTLVAESEGLCGVYFEAHQHPPRYIGIEREDDPVIELATRELQEYFDRRRERFSVPLYLEGTDIQIKVWQQLQQIDFGETLRYRDIAENMEHPFAVRAVGAAIGKNPLSIIIPCHRVLGSDGSLTGFAGGTDRKQWLLNHERPLQMSLFEF